jgi:hypothetical protein
MSVGGSGIVYLSIVWVLFSPFISEDTSDDACVFDCFVDENDDANDDASDD